MKQLITMLVLAIVLAIVLTGCQSIAPEYTTCQIKDPNADSMKLLYIYKGTNRDTTKVCIDSLGNSYKPLRMLVYWTKAASMKERPCELRTSDDATTYSGCWK
jgi:hypothetical protein